MAVEPVQDSGAADIFSPSIEDAIYMLEHIPKSQLTHDDKCCICLVYFLFPGMVLLVGFYEVWPGSSYGSDVVCSRRE